MRDIVNSLDLVQSLGPAGNRGTGNYDGDGVYIGDHNGAMVVVSIGTITDGEHALEIQESNDNGVGDAWAAVAAEDLEDALAAEYLAANSDTVHKVGYKGMKTWLRVVSVVTNGTTGGIYEAGVIVGKPAHVGVANITSQGSGS